MESSVTIKNKGYKFDNNFRKKGYKVFASRINIWIITFSKKLISKAIEMAISNKI